MSSSRKALAYATSLLMIIPTLLYVRNALLGKSYFHQTGETFVAHVYQEWYLTEAQNNVLVVQKVLTLQYSALNFGQVVISVLLEHFHPWRDPRVVPRVRLTALQTGPVCHRVLSAYRQT